MRVRWLIATLGALALALLTLNSSELWFDGAAAATAAGACPANAKKANLNFTLKDVDGKSVTLGLQGKGQFAGLRRRRASPAVFESLVRRVSAEIRRQRIAGDWRVGRRPH